MSLQKSPTAIYRSLMIAPSLLKKQFIPMKILFRSFLFLLFFGSLNSLRAQGSVQEYKVDKISLKINLKPNTSYRFTNNQMQKISQELMGNPIEINQNIQATYTFEVEKNTGEEMEIKVFYQRLAFDMEMPQGKITMDTDEENDAVHHLPHSGKLSEIINKPFYISLSSEGKITKVNGLTELLKEKASVDHPGFQDFFSESNLISAFESSFNVFSEDSIRIGDTWNKTQNRSLNNQFNLNFEESFTLDGLSEDLAWINIESVIKGSVAENSLIDDIAIIGKKEGNIEVERNSGLVLFSETQQELQGFIKIQGMEIPVKASVTNTHSGEKL
jgi:hypothetical protein